jgi:hypothetical protein
MSIYFIRHAGLVKIGFSSNLRERIATIITSIPSSDVTFIGHMPGDREVEAHLHSVFEAHRFSGEWFFFAPPLVQFAMLALIPELPALDPRGVSARLPQVEETLRKTSEQLREWSATRWPLMNHRARIAALVDLLPGWKRSRVQSIYNAERKSAVKPHEAEQIAALLSRVGALDSAVGNPGEA